MPDSVLLEPGCGGQGKARLTCASTGDLASDGNHVYLDRRGAAVVMVDRLSDRSASARFLAGHLPLQ